MGTDSIVYFRVDANQTIASGHMMRCKSIATALVEDGARVCFLLSDSESIPYLEQEDSSFPYQLLSTGSLTSPMEEVPEMAKVLLSGKKDCGSIPLLVVDSYYVTPDYFQALKDHAKLVYLDDLRQFDPTVDFLINYDVISADRRAEYTDFYHNPGICLLGEQYTPLRPQFAASSVSSTETEKIVRRDCTALFFSTGGSDPLNFCEDFLDTVLPMFPTLTIHLLVGNFFTTGDILMELAKKYSTLVLHQNVTQMAALMKECDLAFSAAGTTLYELCAAGVASYSFTLADNQLPTATQLAEIDCIPYLGDIRSEKQQVLSQMVQILQEMTQENSYEKRKTMHQKMHSHIDGLGAKRIARALLSLNK